jgi:hypothetical protein
MEMPYIPGMFVTGTGTLGLLTPAAASSSCFRTVSAEVVGAANVQYFLVVKMLSRYVRLPAQTGKYQIAD